MGNYAFADVEQMLCDWVEARTGVRAVTELPPATDLPAALPVFQVEAFGGNAINAGLEAVTVDVDVFVSPNPSTGEPDPGAAYDLFADLRRRMLIDLPGHVATLGGLTATVTAVVEVSRPTSRPWDESNLRRRHGSYRVTVQSRG